MRYTPTKVFKILKKGNYFKHIRISNNIVKIKDKKITPPNLTFRYKYGNFTLSCESSLFLFFPPKMYLVYEKDGVKTVMKKHNTKIFVEKVIPEVIHFIEEKEKEGREKLEELELELSSIEKELLEVPNLDAFLNFDALLKGVMENEICDNA